MNKWTVVYRLFALSVCTALLTVGIHIEANAWQALGQNSVDPVFLRQCFAYEQLASSERHTIDQLLAEANTTDCQKAHQTLMAKTVLDLQNREIANLNPLSGFSQLETLYLNNNQVTDITPLSFLTNLTTLQLANNQIQDLSPLSGLNLLTKLFAGSNRIASLAPLADITSLTELTLDNNQIEDVRALSSLSRLTVLNLSRNRLTEITTLASLTNLQDLSLSHNRLTQINVLAELVQLSTRLDVRNNLLISKTCPISPATVCNVSDDAVELIQLGQQQKQQESFVAASETLKTALNIYQQNGDRLRESRTLDLIGNVYDDLGQYANALDYYRQSKIIRQRIGDPTGQVETLTNLGITYIRLGQIQKSLTFLQDALQRKAQLEDETVGKVLSHLALAYAKLENYSESLRYAKLSLANYRRRSNPNTLIGESIALNRIGEAYLQLNNLDKARLYLDKAFDFSQAQKIMPSVALSLYNLGALTLHQDSVKVALNKYQAARDIWRSQGDKANEGRALHAIGELYLQDKNIPLAVATFQKTVELWQSLEIGLSDENKISLIDNQMRSYQALQFALLEQQAFEKALEVSESGRARAFAELLAHRLKLRGESVSEIKLQSPSIEQIRAIAQAQKSTLLEYSITPKELYTWVVEPSGKLHFRRQALSAASLQNLVISYRRSLLGGGSSLDGTSERLLYTEDDRNEISKDLYQLLIAPVATVLPAREPIIIIPQGDLFLLPFPSLLDQNGAALIETHPLLFAPAIGLLKDNFSESSRLQLGQTPALVVGNPKMPSLPDAGAPLSQLPETETEAETVAVRLGVEPLIGEAATKAAVLSQMVDARVLHLATHGLLDDFGTDVPGALALAPTSSDAGFLTASEILKLQLKAQLAVLSACDTGLGEITGDGVLGLSRSFLTAGVGSVVVSLWKVPDNVTADFMRVFYSTMTSEPNLAIALQEAMLFTRESTGGDPRAWAAFSLFGEMQLDEMQNAM